MLHRVAVFAAAGLALALACSSPLGAAVIVSVADADPDGPGNGLIASTLAQAVSWTQFDSYSNVTIRAAIRANVPPGPAPTVRVFLTTQIGLGASQAAHEIASAVVPVPIGVSPHPLLTLLSGLSLGPGTYHLSVFHETGGSPDWDFEPAPAVTSDVGALVPDRAQAASPFASYPPASGFAPQSGFGSFFEVTGDPAADPTVNIVWVADGDTDAPGNANIGSNQAHAVSWTQLETFTDVTVRAAIGANLPPDSALPTIRVFLTRQLGPGTTQASDEVASAVVAVPLGTSPHPLVTVLSGLTLEPGTYFLSLFHDSGGSPDWDFEPGTVLLTDVGSTAGDRAAAGSPFDPYPPASNFVAAAGERTIFQVTGERLSVVSIPAATPIGLGALLAALAAAAVGRLRRRAAAGSARRDA